jgi:hypothetical protein
MRNFGRGRFFGQKEKDNFEKVHNQAKSFQRVKKSPTKLKISL